MFFDNPLFKIPQRISTQSQLGLLILRDATYFAIKSLANVHYYDFSGCARYKCRVV